MTVHTGSIPSFPSIEYRYTAIANLSRTECEHRLTRALARWICSPVLLKGTAPMRVESWVIASPFACPPRLSRRSALREGDEVELRLAGLRTVEIARAISPSGEAALARIKESRWKLRPRDNRRVDALERLAGGERYAVVGGHAARHAHRRHAPHRQPVLRHVLNAIILFLQLGYQSLKSRYMRFQRVREQPQICSRWQVLPPQ